MKGINLELTTQQQFQLKAIAISLNNTDFAQQKEELSEIIIDLTRIKYIQQNSLAAAYKEIILSESGLS